MSWHCFEPTFTSRVRALQKRLEGEGVVFSDLLCDIRRRLAEKHLRENYSVEQITYLHSHLLNEDSTYDLFWSDGVIIRLIV
jgi:hypothetical protein